MKNKAQRGWLKGSKSLKWLLLILLPVSMGVILSALFAPWQVFARELPITSASSSIKDQATKAVQTFHSEVADWGKKHQYHDTYDGKDYALDDSYMKRGSGEDLDRELQAGNYEQTLADAQNQLFLLHMLEQDANDSTAVDQPHATDLKLLSHFNVKQKQVIVISTVEESLRLYEKGKVVRGFLITAGSPDLPAVPGFWSSMQRLTKTTFHSPYPKGSPYWYPPTKINYAIMYHDGGYFIHDSWWRADYGQGTQFPHADPSGNKSATVGTHGCINVPEDQMKWLYQHTSDDTLILVY